MAKKKKQSLKEFKAWMDGIEELQPDDWTPTNEQWVLIRNKIDNIVEEKHTPPAPLPVVPQEQIIPQPISAYGLAQAPVVGGVPLAASVDMTDAAKQLMNNQSGGAGGTKQSGEHSDNAFE